MEPGAEIVGRYRLERLLGRGTFGDVWAAADLLWERRVAVRILDRGISTTDPVVAARFRQEAKNAARLVHPGITRVDDFGECEGRWFWVTEFLQGRTLKDELAGRPRGLAMERVQDLGVQLADALAAAHAAGMVHRNLKPANLMMVEGGRLKVCDFGIVGVADAMLAQTFTGQVGTPLYLAPEQWLGRPLDHRTDLYAVGCILYHLVTGRPPFTGEHVAAVMGQHLSLDPPRARTHRPETPAPLDELITELLAKDPGQRPTEADEVLTRLRDLGRPLPAAGTVPAAPNSAPPAASETPSTRPSPARPAGASSRRPRRSTDEKFPLHTTLTGYAGAVTSAAFSPDSRILATASEEGMVCLWDIEARQAIAALAHRGGLGRWIRKRFHDFFFPSTSVVFSPDGRFLATVSRDQTVRLWHATGEPLATLTDHEKEVRSVAFSPDGRLLATAVWSRARLWEVESGTPLADLTGHEGKVESVAFSPDGRLLATGSGDRTVRLWEVESGERSAVLTGHMKTIRAVAFSPDGRLLATGSEDRTVRLWETGTGRPLTTLTGHYGTVDLVVFHPSGRLLATAGADGEARLWDPDAGEPLAGLGGHLRGIWAMTFSPDGRLLATASQDRTARIWQIEV